MESTSPLSSKSADTLSSPQLEGSATGPEQPSTHLSRQLTDMITSHVESSGNKQENPTVSHNHLVETFENMPTTSSAGSLPRIVWKFSSQSKNKVDDGLSKVEDTKDLVAANGEESAKDETKKAERRKQTFFTFSSSLGSEKIETDLLAMFGSNRSEESIKKRRRTSAQNSLEDDDLSSFYSHNNSDTTGSPSNLAVETSESESTSSDSERKSIWKISIAAGNDNKNEDEVTTNAADQTLVSTEYEKPENENEISYAVNQTLIATNGNAAESVQPESTQLGSGIVQVPKEDREKKKRTFSTFSVSLTRDKIDADLTAMGGSKRTRRIKKRPKSLQRQLDDLFPGLRLKFVRPAD